MPKVLIADDVVEDCPRTLREGGIEADNKGKMKPDEVKAIIGGYEGLIVRSAIKVTKEIIDAGANSGAVPGVNVGIGMRRPYESGAWRLEGYFKYMFKNTSLGFPNTTQLGVRAGLSLWH